MDETDEYVDVHKRYGCASIAHTTSAILQLTPSRKQLIPLPYRIRVAAAAAASSVARAPSVRRLTGQKAAVSATFLHGYVNITMQAVE